ncbi:H+/Cl- antiporter ClcA [Mycobacterium sp. MAA66]|uniref:chloride channel protein n=1 Tax=Mycobacterium sp. MAA66 TaxID=3156297 RepID=UPI0035180C65
MTRRTIEYSCALLFAGLLAGVAGIITTELLHTVEHLAYHYLDGTLLDGVGAATPMRRALAPVFGGALVGAGWWLLRRRADRHAHLSQIADAALQVTLVGSGASLGRETAPRQLAAAFTDLATRRLSLTARDREVLLACAAGAGLGAVYSVPLGGAFFAARVLLKTWHPRVVGTALITSSLAVAVAHPVTHFERPLTWPDASMSYLFIGLAVLIAPGAAAVGLAFNRLMALAKPNPQLKSWLLIPGIALAGLAIGLCSIYRPELPGNGRSILIQTTGHNVGLGAAVALFALKPLLTALYLRVGAVGGMITPALATGAAAGTAVTIIVNGFAHTHVEVAAASLTCAAGVLAVTQRAPAFATLFTWEIARPPEWLLLVFLVSAFAAHGIQLLIDRRQSQNSTARALSTKTVD